MIVDLKVHAEIVQYKGRQGSNMRPAKVVFWVRERFFWRGVKDLERKILTWDPRER